MPSDILIPHFQPNYPAPEAHSALRRSLATIERAQHCALLWFGEIMRRGLYRDLGYSSMQSYAREELGFSRPKTDDFVRLATKLEQLPRLKESIARGEVGYTKAREVIKVATARTEEQWAAIATKSPRKVLAAKVERVRKKARARLRNPLQQELLVDSEPTEAVLIDEVPVRVTLEMSPEQFARYEALWEKLHKLGGVPTGTNKVEVLLEALAGRTEELEHGTLSAAKDCKQSKSDKYAPRGATPPTAPRFLTHIHQCPDCNRATVQTGAGEKEIAPAELSRIQCDTRIVQPGGRARSAIPPKTRREVLARDRHQCQGPGCTHTRFLEIHHRRPVAHGGGNELENLITLCGGCHRLAHLAGNRVGKQATRQAALPGSQPTRETPRPPPRSWR